MASLPHLSSSPSPCLCIFSTLVLWFHHFLAVTSQNSAPSPLYHFCYAGGNYTVNSTFSGNLNNLISSLSSLPQNDDGFYNVSAGEIPDKVNSVYLCRGDVKPVDCLACVSAAGEEIRRLCPNRTEAIIFYDNCMTRYTNRTISNAKETELAYFKWNNRNFTGDLKGIETALRGLLEGLRDKAAAGGARKKFAADSVKAPSFKTLYGMVQCMPYLSEEDCFDCLSWSFGEIPARFDRKVGGRVYTPTCFFRYETYEFYDKPPLISSPPPPPANGTITSEGGKKDGNGRKDLILIVVPVVVAVLLIASLTVVLILRKKARQRQEEGEESEEEIIVTTDSLLFDFDTIRDATDNFAIRNKLGQGGFGPVYKGVLPDGQRVAVKRLSRNAGQGETEFKNEVLLVAKLQHRNLVRLLGFSTQGTERLLVYEFVENASLDNFIFDPVKRTCLDWGKRCRIIGGIARGLVYLHEDSRLRIIHRDLKASNVLLDEEMTPKIADFGMARLLDIDQSTQRFTGRIVGTYGYMAPEYAMHGQFSFKTDVYSFGVLVLEIISGQRNNSFRVGEEVKDLVSVAWENWEEETPLKLVDPSMTNGWRNEMERCITIGLLCVQENVGSRPSMAAVVLMLSSDTISLPLPTRPAVSVGRFTRFGDSTSSSTSHGNHDSITQLYPR
ncbi:PREDICTED: cysteine-rich receptor-like protein kinase 26 [Tarenaya hassleriana]|uniref:cysteine-rich receptor-like protein kinase 26 n=1 Tax=Tarenaya hassleriana TaxID=28532 RepID=UPI00053C8002|nr:PREDICTED: cysteine-rich receptor-like protein kinase 26 [Tarenaya hassleriana]